MKRHFNNKITCMAVIVLTVGLLVICAAQAADLQLPAGLKRIEGQAFYGDTSLENVVVPDGTEVIDSEAFAYSNVKTVTLPGSLYFIADNAFEGCENLTVDASEGTYAYTWAVKNKYLHIDDVSVGARTKVVMPTALHAGANLEIQIYGPANTVIHTVCLVNNETNEEQTRFVRSRNGSVKWYGYELENGVYTVQIYTVTGDYGALTPVTGAVAISGTRPVGPEDIQVPDKLGWNAYEVAIAPYDAAIVYERFLNSEGNQLDVWDSGPLEESVWLNSYYDQATQMTISFRCYRNGLWSECSQEKTIEIIQGTYYPENRGVKNISIPDQIVAGTDFEISFECEDNINYYGLWMYDKNGSCICSFSGNVESPVNVVIPGYKTEAGNYKIFLDLYDNNESYRAVNQEIVISEGRKPANVILTADKEVVYTNEVVSLSIVSDGMEGAYIKILGDDWTNYKGCNLQENGSGTCTTSFDVPDSYTHAADIILSACVFLGDSWSEWSEPITVTVSRPEPLPVPGIVAQDNYENGEDIIVHITDIDDADYYYVQLKEYYSGETVVSRIIYKNSDEFGKDVTFSGSLYGSGNYIISVYANSSLRQARENSKNIKVTGTRLPAPTVACNPDEFRINQATTFAIDTEDCEKISIQYTGRGNNYSWGESYITDPAGDMTNWSYRFDNNTENAVFGFTFAVKKDGRWSNCTEIEKTVLGLPPLDPAMIHVDDIIEAGKDFSITVDPVENATRYERRLYRSGKQVNYASSSQPFGEIRFAGYDCDPGMYTIKVWAYADEFAASESTATFTISGAKPAAPAVTIDKTSVFTGEYFTFTIDTKDSDILVVKNRYADVSEISIQGDITTWSQYVSEGSHGIWPYSFAVLKDGEWTEWSTPVEINARLKPNLAQAKIQAEETTGAGNDYSFRFNAVENAATYRVSFASAYGGGTIYSWNSETALPDTDLTVPGYLMNAGSYTLSVQAYAEGYSSSSKTIYVSATGSRPAGPEAAVEEPLRIKNKAVFSVGTGEAEALQVKYQYTAPNYSWSVNSVSVPVTGAETQWTLAIDEYKQGVNLTVSFSAKVNGVWSVWNTKKYTVEGLLPLDPAVIHVDEMIEAGTDFSITFDSVDNATSYWYCLCLPNGNTWERNDYNQIHEYNYYGYSLEPGIYTIRVRAYSNDYTTSESEETFTITGAKPVAPTVFASKNEVMINERFMFTIDTENADALRYRVGSNTNSINVLEDETQWSSYQYSKGIYEYQFAIRRNHIWSAWSDPIVITVTEYEYNPIDAPEITITSEPASGKDLTISLSEVDGAAYYYLYLQKTDGTMSFSTTVYPQNIENYSFPGYRITSGTYTVSAYATNGNINSERTQITITVPVMEKPEAPTITPPENTTVVSGSYLSFAIDSTDADTIAVRSFAVGNPNDLSFSTKTVQNGQNETTWQMYFTGSSRKYSFAVCKDGVWSEWSEFITITSSP